MNRKWRTNPGALDTVLPYPTFRAIIPPRDADYSLADPSDLYSVYTVLHIESKQAELRWSPHGRFYYFLAQWQQAAKEAAVQAPEGDEDPPPQVPPPPAGRCRQWGSVVHLLSSKTMSSCCHLLDSTCTWPEHKHFACHEMNRRYNPCPPADHS